MVGVGDLKMFGLFALALVYRHDNQVALLPILANRSRFKAR